MFQNNILTVILNNYQLKEEESIFINYLQFCQWKKIGLLEAFLPKIRNKGETFNLRILSTEGLENRPINNNSQQLLRIVELQKPKKPNYFDFSKGILQYLEIEKSFLSFNFVFCDENGKKIEFEDDKEIILVFHLIN